MSYQSWFREHGLKHRKIVDKLLDKGFNKDDIIEYFDFDNMVDAEPEFCGLYVENKKCHNIDKLNCYLCACPLFRFNSTGVASQENKTIFSYCEVNAKFGRPAVFDDAIHHDCTDCHVPHGKKYVEKNYNKDWFIIMNECDLNP